MARSYSQRVTGRRGGGGGSASKLSALKRKKPRQLKLQNHAFGIFTCRAPFTSFKLCHQQPNPRFERTSYSWPRYTDEHCTLRAANYRMPLNLNVRPHKETVKSCSTFALYTSTSLTYNDSDSASPDCGVRCVDRKKGNGRQAANKHCAVDRSRTHRVCSHLRVDARSSIMTIPTIRTTKNVS